MNAREHNLKGADIKIPRGKLSVITGVSGSGEHDRFRYLVCRGQRRYLESLNARQFVQPPHAPRLMQLPASRRRSQSNSAPVAAAQEYGRNGYQVYHFLRLMYVKLGTQHCPIVRYLSSRRIDRPSGQIMRTFKNNNVTLFAPLIVARKGYYTDLARWAENKGFSELRVDGD